MIAFVKFNALLLTNYWILSFRQFHFVSGVRPKCVGDALEPEEFSKEKDVGFVRDVCVDIIARNLYNRLKCPVSILCEELANMRTSTCFFKCGKWKRSSSRNREATNQVMTMAEALMEHFNEEVSKEASLNYNDENFIFEQINNAKQRLVNSGAATENSKIIHQLEDMKKYFCTRNQLEQHQRAYQESIEETDAWSMKKLGDLIENKDLITAIKQFIRNFEAENAMKISTYHLEDNVVKEVTMSGIIRLKFRSKRSDTEAGAVILKVPSFAPSYHTKWKYMNLYDREAYFYEKLLPALYKLGQCEPFAPKIYASTEAKGLVLEDLSVEGYGNKIQSAFIDLDHSLISLNVLAKFHALGYAYLRSSKKDDPSISLIGSSQIKIRATRQDEFDALCKVMKPFLSKSLYQKILNVEDEILTELATINDSDINSMTVITHGDFNARNVLFKYDSKGKVFQAKIIDWQFGREASPVLDLIDFFPANISMEIFERNEDYLLNSYLATLNQNLSLLSTNRVYNRPELERDMKFYKYHYFRVLSTICLEILNWKPQDMKPIAEKMAKWVIYFERKGFI